MECMCEYCQGMADQKSEYQIDITSFSRKRPRGVSGILRVKNDAEFLAESIDSCIDALDELIIVYNGCSDESPEIIREKAVQYGDKIKCYEYTPIVYANNLTDEEYRFVKQLPNNSPHLLANYYNYALKKVNYEFVLKIDADQIYITQELKKLCDAYREVHKKWLHIGELFCFLIFAISVWVGKKFHKRIYNGGGRIAIHYKRCLLKLIANYKIQVELSGVNLFFQEKQWYVTLGQTNPNGLNVLPPYNGVGDHVVFRKTSDTFFKPMESATYAAFNSHRRSFIEIFVGVRYPFPYGIVWMHLNAMRKTVYRQQEENFIHSPWSFLSIEQFAKLPFDKIDYVKNPILFSERSQHFFRILHNSFMNPSFIDFVSAYGIDESKFFLVKRKKI